MESRVLGGLAIRAQGRLLALGTPKQRALTALLLVRTNAVVRLSDIADELWGEAPPKSATANLRTYAARLRAALPPAERDRLVVRPLGYQLRVEEGELDLTMFEDRIARGRAALERGDAEEALRQLELGLALWQGRLLEDVQPGPIISARAVTIDTQLQSAAEDRCEALLMLGRPGPAIGILRSLVAEHPLRERAWALLMRAMYAVHDVGGALDAFARARMALVESLGIEPGEDLQQLHQAILRRDLSLVSAATPSAALVARPYQLPPAPAIVERTMELRHLTRHLGSAGTIVGVHGPAGSGKSALALHAARLVAHQYPDGQLYLDLRPGRQHEAGLLCLLKALGVMVADPDVAISHYRSLLADRRMLVMLDNAAEAAQIRPFLLAEPHCTVLVTSCPMLATLDGARHIRLRELSEVGSMALLASYVSSRRLRKDPDAAGELVRLCGRLPLALRIAAARLVAHPDWSVRDLVERLRDDRHRLDELEAGDLAVRTSLRAPYDTLVASERPTDRVAAEVFELLGALPAIEVSSGDLAGVLRVPVADAGRALDRLVEVELLGFCRGHGYRLTGLSGLLAREIATTSERGPQVMAGAPS